MRRPRKPMRVLTRGLPCSVPGCTGRASHKLRLKVRDPDCRDVGTLDLGILACPAHKTNEVLREGLEVSRLGVEAIVIRRLRSFIGWAHSICFWEIL